MDSYSQMKVMHITGSISRAGWGVSSVVRGLAKQHSENGVEVKIFSLNDEYAEEDTRLLKKVEIDFFTANRVAGLNISSGLQSALEKSLSGNDIVHIHGIWMRQNILAGLISKKKQTPYIVSPHGMLKPWALTQGKIKKKLAMLVYQHKHLENAAVLHATSVQEAEQLRKLGFKNHIAIIPNGVSFPSEGKICRNSKSKRTILFLSRVDKIKGLMNLVKAWELLKPIGWQVVIVGPDSNGHTNELKLAINEAGLTADFLFLGSLEGDAKWKQYYDADLFILPTHSENFGLVVPEALYCGLPVITTKGAPWSDLEVYGCGWWIDIGVDPLVTALNEAMSFTDIDRISMGEKGRNFVKAQYSWDKIANEMLSVYRWLLGMSQKPDVIMD